MAKDQSSTAPTAVGGGVEELTQNIMDADASALVVLNQAVTWATTFSVAAVRIENAAARIANSASQVERDKNLAIMQIISQRIDALTAIIQARDAAIAAVQSSTPPRPATADSSKITRDPLVKGKINPTTG